MIIQQASSQTYVSGGIYSNTTWTLANSPYITNNIVVFPNVTLTIEPGVHIEATGGIEVRQATIIAEGTTSDSIIFNANSSSFPLLNLNEAHSSKISFCSFQNASLIGLKIKMYSPADSLVVRHSAFLNNFRGTTYFDGNARIDSCHYENNSSGIVQCYIPVSNTLFKNNAIGIEVAHNSTILNCSFDSNSVAGIQLTYNNEIKNCHFTYNHIGIESQSQGAGSVIQFNTFENNNIGVKLEDEYPVNTISCNTICNNTVSFTTTRSYNSNVSYNYWCTADSAAVAASIYDGYDDVSMGLISFMPIDTLNCAAMTTGFGTITGSDPSYSIYPNPFSRQADLYFSNPQNGKAEMAIYDSSGKSVLIIRDISLGHISIERSGLAAGLYFFQLRKPNTELITGKFIISD